MTDAATNRSTAARWVVALDDRAPDVVACWSVFDFHDLDHWAQLDGLRRRADGDRG